MDWQVKEVQGYAYYMERGYRVSVPIVDTSGYDFIAERDGTCLRVNVKVAGLKSRKHKNSWSIARTGASKKKTTPTCDVFLVYMPNKDMFVEVPGNCFDGYTASCKTITGYIKEL